MKKEVFDIVIQGGQSNAVGYGLGPVDNEYKTNGNVLYLHDCRERYRCETGIEIVDTLPLYIIMPAFERPAPNSLVYGDFSLSFANAYISGGLLAEGRRLIIVKTAVGGTSFMNNDWGVQTELYFLPNSI